MYQGILITDISDHFLIFHIWKNIRSNKANDDEYMIIRQVNDKNKETYQQTIMNWDWKELLQYDSCKEAYSKFFEIQTNIFNQSFPLKKIKKRYRNKIPWLSEDLKQKIKQKNKLYKIKLKHPTCQNIMKYKELRNSVSYEIRKEEKYYYQNLLLKNKNNLRKTWQIIKEVIGKSKSTSTSREFLVNNELVTDKKIIADQFDIFFLQK